MDNMPEVQMEGVRGMDKVQFIAINDAATIIDQNSEQTIDGGAVRGNKHLIVVSIADKYSNPLLLSFTSSSRI
jgi:hypothetical protein